MKIGIENYPFIKFSNIGPKVFLSRLAKNIKKNNLAEIKSSIFPFYDIGLFSVLAKNYYKIPFVLRFDGLYIDKKNTVGNSVLLNNLLLDKSKKSCGIIFQSNFCKNLYEKFFDKPNVSHKVILNRIPKDFNLGVKVNRSKIGFDNDDIVVILSSNWRRHKRLEEALEFLDFFNSKSQKKIKFLVLGKCNIKKEIANVFFAGEINQGNLSKWYNVGDFYFHPAWLEPAANTIVEAIGCNLPIICCNNGGPSQMVKQFNAGIISNCDTKYLYDKVDLYNPPKPNFYELFKSFEEMLNNLKFYQSNIKNDEVSIYNSSTQYISFIKGLI